MAVKALAPGTDNTSHARAPLEEARLAAVYRLGLRLGGAVEAPVLLLFAAGTFFLANTLSVALAIGLTEQKSPWVVWRATYFWSDGRGFAAR